jgi:hypothetical protein
MERDPLGVGQQDVVEATREASQSSGSGGSTVGYRGGAMERQVGSGRPRHWCRTAANADRARLGAAITCFGRRRGLGEAEALADAAGEGQVLVLLFVVPEILCRDRHRH